jgi:biotin carboxylase
VIVIDGRVVECLFHNDTLTPRPITVPIGHSCPSRLSEGLRKEAFGVCQAAAGALGIRNAVCNADLIATGDGIRVLEIGARIGATGIPEIIRLCHGVDLYQVVLRMALGETPEIGVSEGPASAVSIIRASSDGKLVRRRVPRDFDEPEPWQVGHASSAPCARPTPRASNTTKDEQVVEIHFDYSEGDQVKKFRTGPDRIGHVVVVSASSSEAEKLAERVVGSLEILVEPAGGDDGAARTARCLDSGGLEGGNGF